MSVEFDKRIAVAASEQSPDKIVRSIYDAIEAKAAADTVRSLCQDLTRALCLAAGIPSNEITNSENQDTILRITEKYSDIFATAVTYIKSITRTEVSKKFPGRKPWKPGEDGGLAQPTHYAK